METHSVVIFLIGAMMIGLFFYIAGVTQNRLDNAPCEYFQGYPVKDVPFRCINNSNN